MVSHRFTVNKENEMKAMINGILACAAAVSSMGAMAAVEPLEVVPLADNAVRIVRGGRSAEDFTYLGVKRGVKVKRSTTAKGELYTLPSMSVEVDKKAGTITFKDKSGKVILKELASDLQDGEIQGEKTHRARAEFDSPEGEFLCGLGQFQDGYLNARGLPRRLTQVNTQISMPMVTSSRGWSMLWNNPGLTEFNPGAGRVRMTRTAVGDKAVVADVTTSSGGAKEERRNGLFTAEIEVAEAGDYALLLDVGRKMARKHNLSVDGRKVFDFNNTWLPPTASAIVHLDAGRHVLTADIEKDDEPSVEYGRVADRTVFASPVAEGVDYTVFVGNADEAIGTYRSLSGSSPLPPKWAFGYVHCRERYHSQKELLENARKFRELGIPIDVIVQDWQYWGKYGWNAMKFDEGNYPDPKGMMDELHSMDIRLMLSVWSKIDRGSEVGKEMEQRHFNIKGTDWIDFFNPDAANFYWENFNKRLIKPFGIDAWWLDATEPENDDLAGRRVRGGTLAGERVRNSYPNQVSKTIAEGIRGTTDERVMILTRSGAPGLHRYGSFVWSGDVGHDWETLRRQLAGGLGLAAAGHPWWTFDAGGFFRPWGQYKDTGYHETFLRWLEIATFSPMMRVHGFISDTEPWRYGDEVLAAVRKQIALRYRLMPYIYSAAKVVTEGGTMMRPLVMDFPGDNGALKAETEYMFGRSLLVAPVLKAGIDKMDVYLPKVEGGWYGLTSGQGPLQSGRTVSVPVTRDEIPVFVKAGSVLVTAENPMRSTAGSDKVDLTATVHPGADGSFTLYEDAGVDRGYERGECANVRFSWDDANGVLTIGAREGSYPGMPAKRTIKVRRVGGGIQEVVYDGHAKTVLLK